MEKSGFSIAFFCQLFEINACERKRSLDLHVRLAILLRVSETVQLLRHRKHSLNCFLPEFVVFSYPVCMSLLLAPFQIIFPDMTRHDLRAALALGTLLTVRTAGTNVLQRQTTKTNAPRNGNGAALSDCSVHHTRKTSLSVSP